MFGTIRRARMTVGRKIYALIFLSFVGLLGVAFLDSRELASGLNQQKQIELRHLGELALGIVKEEHAAVQTGGVSDADARKRAMARIAAELGKREDAGRWQSQAQVARNALQAAPATDPMYTVTPSILSLLFGGGATEEDAAGLIEALATERESAVFPWLAHGDGRVSMIDAWLIYGGLRRYGFNAVASQVAEQAFRLVEAHGFHEFYDAVTGEEVWTVSYDRAPYSSDLGVGPRATPAVADDRVYTIGITGVLMLEDGRLRQLDDLDSYEAEVVTGRGMRG